MKKTRLLLMKAAQKLELPTDVIAGVPRIEVVGARECSIEPHKGLLEYEENKVSVSTVIGVISVLGSCLEIKRMNDVRITIVGCLHQVSFEEPKIE